MKIANLLRTATAASIVLLQILASAQTSISQTTSQKGSGPVQEEAFSLLVRGVSAFEKGDFAEALASFRNVEAIAIGPIQAKARYYLGRMYQEGKGLKRDPAQAIRWYQQSADQGAEDAQQMLGLAYLVGAGVPRNHKEAANWFRRAAEQGHAPAQSLLGQCYQFGNGVSQDRVEAVKWYRLAAQQGNPLGQMWLGFAYEAGQGVVQDYIQAHVWLNLAASRVGDTGEIGKKVTAGRDAVASKMTPEQLSEAQRLASKWSQEFP